MTKHKKLVLADGREFIGNLFGYDGEVVAEMCFNTSMIGYQEIMTDPSYGGQCLVMTYPLIGSYGVNDDDMESPNADISAFIVDNYIDFPSNYRSTRTFSEELDKRKIVGISNLDTRMLTRIIVDQGSQNVLITDLETPTAEAIEKINAWSFPKDIIDQVSRKKIEIYTPDKVDYKIVAIDHGIKQNQIRHFNLRNCEVVVMPHGTNKEEVLAQNPDGLFFSNGPGDPEWAVHSIQLVKDIKGQLPIFGICLGHQIIGLAYGAQTKKLKFGHRGGNHPVKNHINGRIEITTQNHSYYVDSESLKTTNLELTHTNIHDNTAEGFRDLSNSVMCVQYHPESAPGPEDSEYLFDDYIEMIKKFKGDK